MINELIGRKVGMTQIYGTDGKVVPVTVIEAGPCVVVGKRSVARDGYNAVNLGFGEIKAKRVSKPLRGQYAQGDGKDQKPPRVVREIATDEVDSVNIGDLVRASIFAAGESVDVIGIAKGKGFQGVMRRHNFAGGKESHGSNFHRRPGSIGASADPSRVFKGTRMPGRMGGHRVTIQNLNVERVDGENNLLILRGAVPGAKGALVTIRRRSAQ